MSKTIASVRLAPAEKELVSRLAGALGQTDSSVVSALIPTGDWAEVFLHYPGAKALEVPERLMADGLRVAMAESARPLPLATTNALADSAIPRLYLEWLDGEAASRGVPGPFGGTFVLKKTPEGWFPEPDAAKRSWPDSAEMKAFAEAFVTGSPSQRLEAAGKLLARIQHFTGTSVHELVTKAAGGGDDGVKAAAELLNIADATREA